MSSLLNPDEKSRQAESFAREAEQKERGVIGELFAFLSENKKWWLLPILIVLGLVGVLAVLGGTGLAPFIYTLF
jgi:Family of unknown function (DUF5989)